MGRPQGKVASIDEFETTLRGARVVRASAGREELVGRTLPWATGAERQNNGECHIVFMDQYGEKLAVADVPQDRVRTVLKLVARARREALRRGDYDLTVFAKQSDRVCAIAGIIVCVALSIAIVLQVLLPISRALLASLGQFGPPWLDVVVIVLLWFMFLHLPVICLVFAISAVRRNVRVYRVSRDGLVATTWRGEECVLPWSEIRSVRRGVMGFVIDADGYSTLRMRGKHASYVLESWAQKISPQRKITLNRLLINCFLLFQAGGITAYFLHRAGVPIGVASHPIISYLLVGWMCPIVLAFGPLVLSGIRRCAESVARRKRRAARSRRSEMAEQAGFSSAR